MNKKLIRVHGPTKLQGRVEVSGSKNSALPILAATILLDGVSSISNVPDLSDTNSILKLLCHLGLRAEFLNNNVKIFSTNDTRHIAPYELITSIRASFIVAGPVLARTGLAKIPLPGGCAIGSRPVDIHLKGFEAMGAKVKMEHGIIVIKSSHGLKGNTIILDFPSVGATENLMMAATLAKGKTILKNVAKEPEIIDLANFLNKAGAIIQGAGTDTITIQGVDNLKSVSYEVIPDRIEAATFILATALTRGHVEVCKLNTDHIESLLVLLAKMGVNLKVKENHTVIVKTKRKKLKSINTTTEPYPGFPTDVQPMLMSLLNSISGTSIIKETLFENRFMHVPEMNRMGAHISVDARTAVIQGGVSLTGAPVKIRDLRGGAALLMSALTAEGITTLLGIHHLYRGYENVCSKLNALGAKIEEE